MSSHPTSPSSNHRADFEHVVIYRRDDEFAAWPFNHGVRAFAGDEIVVGFSRTRCDYAPGTDMRHQKLDAEGGEYVFARSSDGGRSWPEENLTLLGTRRTLEDHLLAAPVPTAIPATDWAHPDFMLTAGFGLPPQAAPHLGYIQFSRNRGATWEGPYAMPAFGFRFVQVKPDYIVRADGMTLLFVSVSQGDGRPGTRFIAIYASVDRGQTWKYYSSIQPQSPDRHFVNRYYASPILFPDGRMIAALRCQIDARNAWPELFVSEDGGANWKFACRLADWGGPTHLLPLQDGRVVATYARRVPPYGIRTRMSEDQGRTWQPERVLREDGGSWDLGYPRAAELSNGSILAVYYFNSSTDAVQREGGVRHIAGTFFQP